PIILAGQQVYIAAPASSTPTLDITRTGTLISNELQTPYSQQLNFGVQRELPFNAVLDVNLIYSRTVHEFMRDVDAANFFPGIGPLDRTHRLTVNGIVELPWGFRLSSISTFNSGVPVNATVGSADLNGDGISGDLLPTTRRGDVGRSIDSVSKLNDAIRAYNSVFASKTTPRNRCAPSCPNCPRVSSSMTHSSRRIFNSPTC